MSCSEWRIISFEESGLEIEDGDRGKNYPKKSELLPTGYCPFLNNKNVINDKITLDDVEFITKEKDEILRKGKIKVNDIVLTTRGSVGNVGLFHSGLRYKHARINSGMVIIRNNNDIFNLKYLYQLLKSPLMKNQYKSMSTGTAQPQLPIKDIKKLELIVPPLEEQEKIANILSSLDDKIELNNDMNKTLEEMAQSIFKRWFVDFEFPNEDGEPYKSSGGEMVDSELGMIPKGWEVKSLDEIANFLNGLAMQKFRPLDTDEEFLQVVKIKELKQGSTSSDSDRCSINIDEKYIINDGDVIFAWSGSLDVRIWCGGKAGLNQHLFKVTSDDYPKWFYYLWVKNYLEQFIRIAADRATTMGHIKRSNLTEAKVLVPEENTLRVMGYTLESLVCKFIENNIESKSLVDLRDSLLPKLMSGEIRVK